MHDDDGGDRVEIKTFIDFYFEDYWSFLISRVLLGSSIHVVFSVFYVLVQVTIPGFPKLRECSQQNLHRLLLEISMHV